MRPRNFGIVRPGLYRSGRYTRSELAAVVAEFGVQTVVDLRDADRPKMLGDRTYRALGVQVLRVPVREDMPVSVQAIEAVEAAVGVGRGTLLHCWKGSHRTGAMVALLRLLAGEPGPAVIEDMERYGFGDPAKHPALWEQVATAASQAGGRPCS